MALRETLRNIEAEQSASLALKKQREKERRKEKEKKKDLQRIYEEIEEYLNHEFTLYLEKAGSSYVVQFYNKDRKYDLLFEIIDNFTEIEVKNGMQFETCKYKKEIIEHFEKVYYKILKSVEKEQNLYEEYLYLEEINNLKPIQENKNDNENKELLENFKIVGIVLLSIIFFPIAFLLMIILSVCKYQK